MRSVWKPGWTVSNCWKLRAIKPAPTSKASANEISATTSPPRSNDPPPLALRPPSLSASLQFDLEACRAGARPKTNPVRTAMTKLNPRTRPSISPTGPTSPTRAPIGHQQTQQTARQRKYYAFAQQLADDFDSTCSQRDANGDLFPPRGAAGQQQVGHIDAG